jgi:phosphoglycolate phosphatase
MTNNISFENKTIIVFDLDGTIVHLDTDWHHLKILLSKRYAKLYEGEKCEFEHISACLSQVVKKNDEIELSHFFDMILDYEMKNIRNNKEIEETVFFINHLELFGVKKETKLAILSLNMRDTIMTILKLANLTQRFDLIMGREDVRAWKPNPFGLLEIQKYFNVKKDEMIYFGDTETDTKTGNNAGIEVHLVKELINLVKSKKQKIGIL